MRRPLIFTVTLPRRNQDRQLYQARVKAGLVSKVVIHAAHMFGDRRAIKPNCTWSEKIRRPSHVEQLLSCVVKIVAFDGWQSVTCIWVHIHWKYYYTWLR